MHIYMFIIIGVFYIITGLARVYIIILSAGKGAYLYYNKELLFSFLLLLFYIICPTTNVIFKAIKKKKDAS
jgi:hypothetical protein